MENMIYNDLSFTLSHQRVEEYINSLPIETDMKEKMYQNILKGSLRSDKVKNYYYFVTNVQQVL